MVKFWIYDASTLANKNHMLELWPYQYLSMERKFNSISRLIIYLTIIGYFFSRQLNVLVAGIITLLMFITLYHVQKNDKREGMGQYNKFEKYDKGADFKNIMKDTFTLPTRTNPLMNVMMDDYKYNNKKKKAAPSYNKSVLKNINKVSKTPLLSNGLTKNSKLFRDLGDNLNFEHQMRNFHTMPNTQIPNNQRSFAEFCYGNMASCKDGDDVSCSKNLRRVGPVSN
jgi:hypothetical protein